MVLLKFLLLLFLKLSFTNAQNKCLDVSSKGKDPDGLCNIWNLGFYALISNWQNTTTNSYSISQLLLKVLERCSEYQEYAQTKNGNDDHLSKIVFLFPDDWSSTGIRMDDPQALLPSRFDQYDIRPNEYTNDTAAMKRSLRNLFLLAETKLDNCTSRAIYFFTDIDCDEYGFGMMGTLIEVFMNYTTNITSSGVPFRLFWLEEGKLKSCLPYFEKYSLTKGDEDYIQWIDYIGDIQVYADKYGMCPEKPNMDDPMFKWWILALGVVIFIILIVFIVWLIKRVCPRWLCCIVKNLEPEALEKQESRRFSNLYSGFGGYHKKKLNESHDEWEISLDSLHITDKILGSGAYATVYLGVLQGQLPLLKVTETIQLSCSLKRSENRVAVKMSHPHASLADKSDFMQEIIFMKALGYHPHLSSLLGCQSDPFHPCIVTELCEKGDLLDLLRSQIRGETDFLEASDFIAISWQVGDALVYLTSKNIIHRDVAARNILVGKNKIVKLSDFGLCRFNEVSLYTTRGVRLPIKWMAPESLEFAQFSTKSDVWSYGVFLFELYSWGLTPYLAVLPDEMVDYLKKGNRLNIPDCPVILKSLMRRCWEWDPELRPDFIEIRQELYGILETSRSDYGYLEIENNTCKILLDEI